FMRQVIGPGRVDQQTLHVKRGKTARACYREGQQAVFIHPDEPIKTVVHEAAHWLEYRDPKVLQAAVDFWTRRTAGERFQRLQVLQPGMRYGATEKTKKDRFIDPYMGKVYYTNPRLKRISFNEPHDHPVKDTIRATELVSMGLELLYDDALSFLDKDPEHFAIIWKVLTGND
ncbi:MAG: hypothetical protein ACAI44_39775, partial [Candidatus Sericytochromatia bacterium]